MTVSMRLAERFLAAEHEALADHTRLLASITDEQVEYQLAGQPVVLPRTYALSIARQVQAHRREVDLRVARMLRCFAEHPPEIPDTGRRNLASWVGLQTRPWYTVFSYSSPDPASPWFCSLDLEAQRFVLLLVAEILESQT